MRSSSGEHYVGLDHIRAIAAFLVFSWHFLHIHDGHLIPLPGTFDFWAFSLLAEGHTGVSLFMVLSGYLFARIAQGKRISYRRFYAARALRLLPLLIAVCAVFVIKEWIKDGPDAARLSLENIAYGPILPTLPNGGWSITVEVHFYILFPLILLIAGRRPSVLVMLVLGALLLRFLIYSYTDSSIQLTSYLTIIGRIDQFLFGMLIARYRSILSGSHLIAACALCALVLLYGWFDRLGGWYSNNTLPSVWVYLLTVEGLIYALLIGWYDTSFRFKSSGLSGLIAQIGSASYSIYLLHFFFVFEMAEFIDQNVVRLDQFSLACLAGLVCFIPVSFLSWLCYRHFELYWLKFRAPYLSSDLHPTASTPKRQRAFPR